MQTKNVNVLSEKGAPSAAGASNAPPPPPPATCGPPLPPRALAGHAGPCKPPPPPKPLPPPTASAAGYSPPPYRMPPLPAHDAPPPQAQQPPPAQPPPPQAQQPPPPALPGALHTHSSKFPIEREVVLSSGDKNSKIPILHEYNRRQAALQQQQQQQAQQSQQQAQQLQLQQQQAHRSAAAVAPDGPRALPAWLPPSSAPSGAHYARPAQLAPSPAPQGASGAVARQWHEDAAGAAPAAAKDQPHKAFPARTYHTIKDMISSRFGKEHPQQQQQLQQPPPHQLQQAPPSSSASNGPSAEDDQGPHVALNNHTGTFRAEYAAPLQAPAQPPYQLAYQPAYQPAYQQPYHHAAPSPSPAPAGAGRSALEQAGIYMVMRQPPPAAPLHHQQQQPPQQPPPPPPQQQQQQAAPGSRRGSHGRLDAADAEAQGGRQEEEEDDDDEGGFAPAGGVGGGGGAGGGGGGSGRSGRRHAFLRPASRAGTAGGAPSSGHSSDYEKGTQRSSGQDSGRGSTVCSAGGGEGGGGGGRQQPEGASAATRLRGAHTPLASSAAPAPSAAPSAPSAAPPSGAPAPASAAAHGLRRASAFDGRCRGALGDADWVDLVESELRHILDPQLHGLPPGGVAGGGGGASTLSDSLSSVTPPLPPLSPGDSSAGPPSPRPSARPSSSAPAPSSAAPPRPSAAPSSSSARWPPRHAAPSKGGERAHRQLLQLQLQGPAAPPLSASVFGLDAADATSTTTALDSAPDAASEDDDEEDEEGGGQAADARAIRRQLQGLEHMYSEVLKLLGVKRYGGAAGAAGRYQPSDPRVSKRRAYGSLSSLPSSVSSRPLREKRRHDERKKVKDMKGINKRFQRLESHVVTLARSVAHLSSEMRTQHLMIQEMENIRSEISALRTQTLAVRSQSVPRGLNTVGVPLSPSVGTLGVSGLAAGDGAANLSNPARVKKLTKFFGDEPPLLRLFLKRLGYEKYAPAFEQERVGMVELPYLSEERLQRLGVPLGPRLRILQEAAALTAPSAPPAPHVAPSHTTRGDKVYVV